MLQSIKNFIGDYKGFGRCPMCNKSWWGNDPGTIWYHKTRDKQGITGTGHLICKDCFKTNPIDSIYRFVAKLNKRTYKYIKFRNGGKGTDGNRDFDLKEEEL